MELQGRFRIQTTAATEIYLNKLANAKGISLNEVINTHIKVAMESSKQVSEELERKRLQAVAQEQLREANVELDIQMKKGFLLENYKKLFAKIIHSSMAENRKKDIIDAMQNRLKLVLGETSDEYKEAVRYGSKEGHTTRKERKE